MRGKLALILVALALVAAACGDDADETTTTAAPPATTTTEAPPATTEPPATTQATTTTAAPTTTTAADACSPDQLELVEPGVLTIATGEPAFPPWVGTTDGENFDVPESKTGFEAALAYEVATALGFTDEQVVWVRTGFDEAIAPGPKSFDFNLQQYSITEQRDEVVDFSEPYYETRQALLALADSPVIGATTLADLRDAKLGAQIGTTSLDFIEDVIMPTDEAAVYDTNVDAKSALEAQQIDGIVVDVPTAFFITAVEIPEASIVAQFETPATDPDLFGLLMQNESPLKPCIDEVIIQLRNDGTLATLEQEWLADAAGIPVISG